MIEPTISYGLPFDEYLRLEGISNSMLNELNKSPAHFHYAVNHSEKKESEAMAFGTMIHTAILEPEELEKRYVPSPFTGDNKLDKRKTADKEKWEQFVLQCGGRLVIQPREMEALKIIREKIAGHSMAPALLTELKTEVSFQWSREDTVLKGRCDAILHTLPGILDIKTTNNASFGSFTNSIFRLGYHRQAAFYLEGLKNFFSDLQYSFIIAVENDAPYNIEVYQIPGEVIELGQKEIETLLKKHKDCCDKKEWQGYSNEIQVVGVPNWYLSKKSEDELNE